MAIYTGVNERNPTHHLSLTHPDLSDPLGFILCDGRGDALDTTLRSDPLPRGALKIYQGSQSYSDMEPPFTPINQRDWSGGRGNLSLDDDATRYADGWRITSDRLGKVLLGGADTYGFGYKTFNVFTPQFALDDGGSYGPLTYNWLAINTDYAVKFTVGSSGYTPTKIYFCVRQLYDTPNDLTIYIKSDSSGDPGTVLATSTISSGELKNNEAYHWYPVTVAPGALSASTDYWIHFSSSVTGAGARYEILTCYWIETPRRAKTYNGATWDNSNYNAFFRIVPTPTPYKAFFFEHKKALYMVQAFDDGTTPRLWINGYIGVATAGTTTTLTGTGTPFTANEWRHAVCTLYEGTGSNQEVNYSRIASNTTSVLTFADALNVAGGANTIFVISGTQKWTEITGHGLTGPITDVLSTHHIVYFAQGDSVNIRRMRWYNSGGTWTAEYTDDGTNKATYLRTTPRDAGSEFIWKGNRGTPAQVARAQAVDGSGTGAVANLSFGTAITVGDLAERINQLSRYGTDSNLMVMKEGSVYEIRDSASTAAGTSQVPQKLDIDEMVNVRDIRNGKAALHHGVYFFFSVHDTLQRYYSGQIDSVGPDEDEGLPADRRGNVIHLTGFPGRLYAAIDGGGTRLSSVLLYNYRGWHEIYRGYAYTYSGGEVATAPRIRSLFIQSIEGDTVDRLWISIGDDVVWVPISQDPQKFAATGPYFFPYAYEGHLIFSYLYNNLQEVEKFWYSLKLLTKGLGSSCKIGFDYRVNDTDDWTAIYDSDGEEFFDESFSQERVFDWDTQAVASKRLQIRLRLVTYNSALSPTMLSAVVEAITRLPQKRSHTIQFRVADYDHDLKGDNATHTVSSYITNLEAITGSAQPSLIASIDPLIDAKWGFLEQGSIRVVNRIVEQSRVKYVMEGVLVEL